MLDRQVAQPVDALNTSRGLAGAYPTCWPPSPWIGGIHTKPFIDLTKLDDSPIDWLFQPWIERTATTLLVGEGGVGKSWLEMDMATAAASGQKWLGHNGCPPIPVMVLDQDTGENITKRRIQMLCRGRGVQAASLAEQLFVLPRCGFRIDKPDHRKWLIAEAKARSIRFLMVDALVAIHGSDENNANEMAKILRGCIGEVIDKVGAGLSMIHHMNKPTKENQGNATHRVRGSGEIVNSSDCKISFIKQAGVTKMVLDRSRSAAEEDWPNPITFRIEKDLAKQSASLKIVDDRQIASAVAIIMNENLKHLTNRKCHAALAEKGHKFSESTVARAKQIIRKADESDVGS